MQDIAEAKRIIRKFKIRQGQSTEVDDIWNGRPSIRKQFFRATEGLTISELSEHFAQYMPERPDWNETIEIVSRAVDWKAESKAEKRSRLKAAGKLTDEIERELERNRRNRLRPYDCPGCADIAYHSGYEWKGTCECGDTYRCRDNRPEELLGEIAAVESESEIESRELEAVPF